MCSHSIGSKFYNVLRVYLQCVCVCVIKVIRTQQQMASWSRQDFIQVHVLTSIISSNADFLLTLKNSHIFLELTCHVMFNFYACITFLVHIVKKKKYVSYKTKQI